MARRPAQQAPRLPEETAPESWLRNLRVSGFTFVMLGLLILAVVVLAPNLRILVEQRQEIATLQQQVDAAQQSVESLGSDVARWSDPTYIKSQARERLFYGLPGEISYLVVGGAPSGSTAPDGQPISTDVQQTQVDWVGTLLGSVYAAGLTQAPPEQLGVLP